MRLLSAWHWELLQVKQSEWGSSHLTLAITVLSIKLTRWKARGQSRGCDLLLWGSLVLFSRKVCPLLFIRNSNHISLYRVKKWDIAITYPVASNCGCSCAVQTSRSLQWQPDKWYAKQRYIYVRSFSVIIFNEEFFKLAFAFFISLWRDLEVIFTF